MLSTVVNALCNRSGDPGSNPGGGILHLVIIKISLLFRTSVAFFNSLISWRLGITGLSKNYHLDEDSICPLCNTDYVYNFQKHLLSHCSATIHLLYNYMEKIKDISEEYYKRYCKTPSDL